MAISLGIQLWNQVFTWEESRRAAELVDSLGFDHLWTWEHALACMGEPDQDTFDAYTLLAGWSQVTTNVRLGVLVGANTFWNPGLLAKKVVTLDHLSAGRAILGIGGGWFEGEHTAFGVDFGTGWGDRLSRLDESVAALRALLDGETVTSPDDGHYDLDGAYLKPLPIQERLPILIGGSGERRTLRTVARYADMWNMVAYDLDYMRRKDEVLRQRCEEAGRDHTEIERTAFLSPVVRETEAEAMRFFEMQMEANRLTADVLDDADIYVVSQDRMIELMVGWKELGFETFIVETAAPFDHETIERFATEIRPVVDRA
ncbi:MAG TPA: LLM class flavin-dependent oxidoreductase [Acidimicrobiia bacterium]|nr:LLM class flavin-dependent oxidoreductase [Acidimicrobiia bacterium]